MHFSEVRAYEGNEPYIFASYAHKDSEQVLPVISQLQQRGYRVWYDEGIVPGSEWPENIAQHLNDCAAVIVFLSPNCIDSANCRREITYALSKNKPFLGLFLEPTTMSPGMELQIATQQCVMKYAYADEALFYEKLCSCPDLQPCKEVMPTQPVAPQPVYQAAQPAAVPVQQPAANPAAQPVAKKRSSGLRICLIALVALLAIGLISTLIVGSPGSDDGKVFTGDGYKITLTEDFAETYVSGYTAAYESENVFVLVLNDEFAGSEDYTLSEYAELVMISNGGDYDLKWKNGIPYFEYSYEDGYETYHYIATMHQGPDSFWLVQFVTVEEDASKYRSDIFGWAGSLRFTN